MAESGLLHLPPSISTSSLLWNQWPPKCCFGGPNNRVDSPDVPSETAVQDCNVMLKDHILWLVVWAAAGMLGRAMTPQQGKWKLLFMSGCTCKSTVTDQWNFKLMWRQGKCMSAFGDYSKKLWYFSDINEPHLLLRWHVSFLWPSQHYI